MSISLAELNDKISSLEKRVAELEGSSPNLGSVKPLNPNLPICKSCGEGNVRLVEHVVRDDVFGKKLNAMVKKYECDACGIKTQINDSNK